MSPELSRSSRPAAAQLARSCSGLVAPNSTLVTRGLVNGKASASAAAVVPSEAARLARSAAAATAWAARGSSSAAAARPAAVPDRYFPLSTPPSRQNEATTPAPAACSALVISVPSTHERRTRLYGNCAAHGGATPEAAAAATASASGPACQLTTAHARAFPECTSPPTAATMSATGRSSGGGFA